MASSRVDAGDDIVLELPVTVDYWQYENAFDPNERPLAPMWILDQATIGDRRHGSVVLVFGFTPPAGLPAEWEVTEARLRVYDTPLAQWDPAAINDYGLPAELQLFKAGFGPSYDEATWDGTQPHVAPYEPFGLDRLTGVNATNDVTTAAPWAVGTPIGYTPGAMSAPFPIDYEFDTAAPDIQAELRADVLAGRSAWFLSATHDLDAIGSAGTVPSVITQEGVDSFPGAVAPALHLTLTETSSAAADWTQYE